MMQIRPIRSADNLQLKKVIQADIREYHNDVPGSPYYDEMLATLAQFYAQQSRAAYWVAEAAGQILGGAGFGPFAYPDTAELQKLYLAPSARGQDIGHALVDRATQGAQESGYKLLYIETFHNYRSARGLYEHLGFKAIAQPLAKPAHAACDTWYLKQI